LNRKQILDNVERINTLALDAKAVFEHLRVPVDALYEVTCKYPADELALRQALSNLKSFDEALDKALMAYPALKIAPSGMCGQSEAEILEQLGEVQRRIKTTTSAVQKSGFPEFSDKIVKLNGLCLKIIKILSTNADQKVDMLVQVARDLTQTLMIGSERQNTLEYQGLLSEMRSLRLQLGADELADHLQIVAQISRGADRYGVDAMNTMQITLKELHSTSHWALEAVRNTYSCILPCCVSPTSHVREIEQHADTLCGSMILPRTEQQFKHTCHVLISLNTESLTYDFEQVLELCYGLDELQEITEKMMGKKPMLDEKKLIIDDISEANRQGCCG